MTNEKLFKEQTTLEGAAINDFSFDKLPNHHEARDMQMIVVTVEKLPGDGTSIIVDECSMGFDIFQGDVLSMKGADRQFEFNLSSPSGAKITIEVWYDKTEDKASPDKDKESDDVKSGSDSNKAKRKRKCNAKKRCKGKGKAKRNSSSSPKKKKTSNNADREVASYMQGLFQYSGGVFHRNSKKARLQSLSKLPAFVDPIEIQMGKMGKDRKTVCLFLLFNRILIVVAQAYVVCPEHIDLSMDEDDDQSSLQKLEHKLGELANLLGLPASLKVRLEKTDTFSSVSSCLPCSTIY